MMEPWLSARRTRGTWGKLLNDLWADTFGRCQIPADGAETQNIRDGCMVRRAGSTEHESDRKFCYLQKSNTFQSM